jgi:hypothetical protein
VLSSRISSSCFRLNFSNTAGIRPPSNRVNLSIASTSRLLEKAVF